MEIHRSAFKHGVAAEDIVHAVGNAVEIVDLDAESDPPKVWRLDLIGRGAGLKSSGSGSLTTIW